MHDLIDRWLRGSWQGMGLRFPSAVEYRFEADTGRARRRTLAIFGSIGVVTALLLAPRLQAALPDLGRVVMVIGAMSAIWVCAIASVIFMEPSAVLREWAITCAHALSSLGVIGLLVVSRTSDVPVLTGTGTLLIVFGTIGLPLRFPYALAVTAVIFCAELIGLRLRPDLPDMSRLDLLLLTGCTAGFSLMANWRLERQFRRMYLLGLRDQLQRVDMTQRNQELDELSRRDALTGLANRRAYDIWLARAWQQALESGGELGLIVIDIDRFKLYNDFYGHAAGDACLQKVARCLAEQLRGTSDLVARLGGEEFAVLLPTLAGDMCADVAERLRVAVGALELPHIGLRRDGLVSVSAGVASRITGGAMTPAGLFAAADVALYQAKAAGRDRVCVSTARAQALDGTRI